MVREFEHTEKRVRSTTDGSTEPGKLQQGPTLNPVLPRMNNINSSRASDETSSSESSHSAGQSERKIENYIRNQFKVNEDEIEAIVRWRQLVAQGADIPFDEIPPLIQHQRQRQRKTLPCLSITLNGQRFTALYDCGAVASIVNKATLTALRVAPTPNGQEALYSCDNQPCNVGGVVDLDLTILNISCKQQFTFMPECYYSVILGIDLLVDWGLHGDFNTWEYYLYDAPDQRGNFMNNQTSDKHRMSTISDREQGGVSDHERGLVPDLRESNRDRRTRMNLSEEEDAELKEELLILDWEEDQLLDEGVPEDDEELVNIQWRIIDLKEMLGFVDFQKFITAERESNRDVEKNYTQEAKRENPLEKQQHFTLKEDKSKPLNVAPVQLLARPTEQKGNTHQERKIPDREPKQISDRGRNENKAKIQDRERQQARDREPEPNFKHKIRKQGKKKKSVRERERYNSSDDDSHAPISKRTRGQLAIRPELQKEREEISDREQSKVPDREERATSDREPNTVPDHEKQNIRDREQAKSTISNEMIEFTPAQSYYMQIEQLNNIKKKDQEEMSPLELDMIIREIQKDECRKINELKKQISCSCNYCFQFERFDDLANTPRQHMNYQLARLNMENKEGTRKPIQYCMTLMKYLQLFPLIMQSANKLYPYFCRPALMETEMWKVRANLTEHGLEYINETRRNMSERCRCIYCSNFETFAVFMNEPARWLVDFLQNIIEITNKFPVMWITQCLVLNAYFQEIVRPSLLKKLNGWPIIDHVTKRFYTERVLPSKPIIMEKGTFKANNVPGDLPISRETWAEHRSELYRRKYHPTSGEDAKMHADFIRDLVKEPPPYTELDKQIMQDGRLRAVEHCTKIYPDGITKFIPGGVPAFEPTSHIQTKPSYASQVSGRGAISHGQPAGNKLPAFRNAKNNSSRAGTGAVTNTTPIDKRNQRSRAYNQGLPNKNRNNRLVKNNSDRVHRNGGYSNGYLPKVNVISSTRNVKKVQVPDRGDQRSRMANSILNDETKTIVTDRHQGRPTVATVNRKYLKCIVCHSIFPACNKSILCENCMKHEILLTRNRFSIFESASANIPSREREKKVIKKLEKKVVPVKKGVKVEEKNKKLSNFGNKKLLTVTKEKVKRVLCENQASNNVEKRRKERESPIDESSIREREEVSEREQRRYRAGRTEHKVNLDLIESISDYDKFSDCNGSELIFKDRKKFRKNNHKNVSNLKDNLFNVSLDCLDPTRNPNKYKYDDCNASRNTSLISGYFAPFTERILNLNKKSVQKYYNQICNKTCYDSSKINNCLAKLQPLCCSKAVLNKHVSTCRSQISKRFNNINRSSLSTMCCYEEKTNVQVPDREEIRDREQTETNSMYSKIYSKHERHSDGKSVQIHDREEIRDREPTDTHETENSENNYNITSKIQVPDREEIRDRERENSNYLRSICPTDNIVKVPNNNDVISRSEIASAFPIVKEQPNPLKGNQDVLLAAISAITQLCGGLNN